MSKSIDPTCLNQDEIASLRRGVSKYLWIQEHRFGDLGDAEFQKRYAAFYFRPSFSIGPEGNKAVYFAMLREIRERGYRDPIAVMAELYRRLPKKKLFFSYATKAVHTFDPVSPIFDSTVEEYLIEREGIPLEWGHPYRDEATARRDFDALKRWYASFLATGRAKRWIAAFDALCPDAAGISPTKKVDFLIYSCSRD